MSGIQIECLIMWSDHLKTGKSLLKVECSEFGVQYPENHCIEQKWEKWLENNNSTNDLSNWQSNMFKKYSKQKNALKLNFAEEGLFRKSSKNK